MGLPNSGSSSKLIEFGDEGFLIEVTSPENDARPVASKFAQRVSGRLGQIEPMIEAACRPIFKALRNNAHSEDGVISKVEVELGFNLEAEGNPYIAKSANEATIKVKLMIERNNNKF
jgi:hypothetical protein